MAYKLTPPSTGGGLEQLRRDLYRLVGELNLYFAGGDSMEKDAAPIRSRVYSEAGVEVCEIVVRNGADTHTLKLTALGSRYEKNGTLMWKG